MPRAPPQVCSEFSLAPLSAHRAGFVGGIRGVAAQLGTAPLLTRQRRRPPSGLSGHGHHSLSPVLFFCDLPRFPTEWLRPELLLRRLFWSFEDEGNERERKKSQRIMTPAAETQVGPLARGLPSLCPAFGRLRSSNPEWHLQLPSVESWPNQVSAAKRLGDSFLLPHSNLGPPPCLS